MKFTDDNSNGKLITLVSIYGLLMGIAQLPVGLFVGWHILMSSLIHLGTGIGFTVWRLRR